MFTKPDVGATLTVTTDWSDYYKGFVEHVRINNNRRTISGRVVASEHFNDPNSFRLQTNNPNFPVSVVPIERVIKMTYIDGTKATERPSVALVDKETWAVAGSKASYVVTLRGSTWNCECKGWQFRGQCKHVNEKKQEVLDRS